MDHPELKQIYYKNNRLQQIRGFCNVAKYGSMKKAADAIGLTPSTVSLIIKSLERDLGESLVIRSSGRNGKLRLTEYGKIFYDASNAAINPIDDLFDNFFLKQVKIKIAAHHSVYSSFLPFFLKKIKDKNPNLKISLSYYMRNEAFDKLTNNEIDLAIYPFENPNLIPRNLSYEIVHEYKPALIMPKNHPLSKMPNHKITFEEIGKYNYIHTGSYAISDIMKDNINAKILKSDIEINYGSWDILESLVLEGLGVTIFHEDYIKNRDKLVVKPVYHLSPNIAYYAIINKGVKRKKIVSDLIKKMVVDEIKG